MTTLVLGAPPPELEALLERRRQAGVDRLDEVLLVDPAERSITWLALAGGEYRPVERSRLIDLGPIELADRIDWP